MAVLGVGVPPRPPKASIFRERPPKGGPSLWAHASINFAGAQYETTFRVLGMNHFGIP